MWACSHPPMSPRAIRRGYRLGAFDRAGEKTQLFTRFTPPAVHSKTSWDARQHGVVDTCVASPRRRPSLDQPARGAALPPTTSQCQRPSTKPLLLSHAAASLPHGAPRKSALVRRWPVSTRSRSGCRSRCLPQPRGRVAYRWAQRGRSCARAVAHRQPLLLRPACRVQVGLRRWRHGPLEGMGDVPTAPTLPPSHHGGGRPSTGAPRAECA